jgi:hypothetical protein
MGKERREAKRISYICEVECEGAGISRLTTRITDLSATGLFIDSMSPIAVGTLLKLKFKVKDRHIETEGIVRYSLPQMGMGVQFTNLSREHNAILEHLIDGKPLPEPDPVTPQHATVSHHAPEPQAQNVLMGNFAIVSLFDVIQMIENSKHTGALFIHSPNVNGEIYINEGNIVGARSELNVSVDALSLFLDVTEGVFEFKKSDTEFQRTIQASSNMGLLLDLLRVKDEEAAFS